MPGNSRGLATRNWTAERRIRQEQSLRDEKRAQRRADFEGERPPQGAAEAQTEQVHGQHRANVKAVERTPTSMIRNQRISSASAKKPLRVYRRSHHPNRSVPHRAARDEAGSGGAGSELTISDSAEGARLNQSPSDSTPAKRLAPLPRESHVNSKNRIRTHGARRPCRCAEDVDAVQDPIVRQANRTSETAAWARKGSDMPIRQVGTRSATNGRRPRAPVTHTASRRLPPGSRSKTSN